MINVSFPKKAENFIEGIKRGGIRGVLYLEGSYARGEADKYSDLDFTLEVDGSDYDMAVRELERVLKTLSHSIFVLNYGEDEGYPGYGYLLAAYTDSGPFQVVDVCVKVKGKKNHRGFQKEVWRNEKKMGDKEKGVFEPGRLNKRQKAIVVFWFKQPGLVKKIFRERSDLEIREAFNLKLLRQLEPLCDRGELEVLRAYTSNGDWIKAVKEGWSLYERKTTKEEPDDPSFKKLKAVVIKTVE